LAQSFDFDPPSNRRTAIRWYRAAAKQGNPDAQNLLGENYRDGWTVAKDIKTVCAGLNWLHRKGIPSHNFLWVTPIITAMASTKTTSKPLSCTD